MSLHSIPDYGLTPKELEDKYEKSEQHTTYSQLRHREAGSSLAYWPWVVTQLQLEEEELCDDSPF